MARILCVDDEAATVTFVQRVLSDAGHDVETATNVERALQIIRAGNIDLVLSDYSMPGANGLELLSLIQDQNPDLPLIMITGHGSIENAVATLKAGAFDYLTKPIRQQQLEVVVEQALEFVRLRKENEVLRQEVGRLRTDRTIIGDNQAFHRIMDTLHVVAPTRATVLLQGESGTGKELLARAIHEMSDRSTAPFISVNCGALPESLIEATLFGHEKGAFTGAIRQVKGVFERAHLGTLLLDEISEMRLDLQPKLLRVLQEQEFERVGGTTPVKVNVRVIATTNRDLALHVQNGLFREDLYYRLAVVRLLVPPLRDRKDDIPILARHFAVRAANDMKKKLRGITTEAMTLLTCAEWPGNIRQLAHRIERAVILSRDGWIRPELLELPGTVAIPIPHNGATEGAALPGQVLLSTLRLDDAETRLIAAALAATNGNRTQAAALLGVSVRTLRNKLNSPADPADTTRQ